MKYLKPLGSPGTRLVTAVLDLFFACLFVCFSGRQCLSNAPLCVISQDRVEPPQVVGGIKDHLLTLLNGKVDGIHNLISKVSPVKNLERNRQSKVVQSRINTSKLLA